jgi:hypothetical protein
VVGRYVFQRLRRALLPDFQRLWTRDIESSVNEDRRRLSAIEAELVELRAFRNRILLADWTRAREPLLARLDQISLPHVREHVSAAIATAEVVDEPTPHMVVDNVLPDDIYELLTASIPPTAVFPDRDPVKRDLETSALASAPPLTARMWSLFDTDIVAGMVAPLVFERFRPAIVAHYAHTGGDAFGEKAAAIRHRPFAGRIQLRRPGYQLKPHLDPRRVAVTGLFYFPRPGDTEDYGTQLYSVDPPVVASGMATFFPETAGARCTLVRTVPYRANSMLAFVNSRAAHGATLPEGAPLSERYTYQFYVKPDDGELKKLLRELTSAHQASWADFLNVERRT